jgi:hypothetical protein
MCFPESASSLTLFIRTTAVNLEAILKTRLTAALGGQRSASMETRHMKITEGGHVWCRRPAGRLAAPGWENGQKSAGPWMIYILKD